MRSARSLLQWPAVAALILILVAIGASCSSQPFPGSSEEAALANAVTQIRSSQGAPWGITLPGLAAAAIANPDDPDHVLGVVSGASDPPGDTELLPTNRFHVGSVIKAFAAALIMRLDQSGDLSLKDSISNWIRVGLQQHQLRHARHRRRACTGAPWAEQARSCFFEPLALRDSHVWEGAPEPQTVGGSRLDCGFPTEPKCVEQSGFEVIPVTEGFAALGDLVIAVNPPVQA